MKKTLLAAMAATMVLSSSLTAFAAPETMPDGTIFDAEYYAQNNPDVVAVFGTDKDVLFTHYTTYGKTEGRLPYANSNNSVLENGAVLVSSSTDAFPDHIVDIYSDGSKVHRVVGGLTARYDSIYAIYRTDYSDGLLDKDGNGIDDRDIYNSCGYTDLDFDCIADGALFSQEYLDLSQGYTVEHGFGGATLCEHGVLWGGYHGMCLAPECVYKYTHAGLY